MKQQLVRFRHIPVSAPKQIPAALKVSKDGSSATVVQPRIKIQTCHITVAFRLNQDTKVLSMAFSICHPDDVFNKWFGKMTALRRFDAEETVEIIDLELSDVHYAVYSYVKARYHWDGFNCSKDNLDPQVRKSILRWSNSV